MKKILSLLVLTVVLATGCKTGMTKESTVKKAESEISFEYEAMTRGSFRKIIVKHDTIISIKDREMKDVVTTTTNKKDWDVLMAEVAKINLDTLKDLKAPTSKRMYDGALIGSLKVIKNGETYQTSGFDHGQPPAEIETLVNKIIGMSAIGKKK